MAPLSSVNKNPENSEENVDVQKIGQLSQSEFKEQIQLWMTQQEGKLHAKLRKDLIESFTRTNLGRTLDAELQQKQGIVLSPLVLVLNTLVSEFLFSQNYHYTLCVFSSEVVFPHTLPDFSKPEEFRFGLEDLQEILQALGLQNTSKALKDSILRCYDNDTSRSLLFAIIKCVIDEIKVERERYNKETQVDFEVRRESLVEEEFIPETGTELVANVKNLSSLNRTIEKLSKSVKNMADHFEQVENSRRAAKSHQSSPSHRHSSKVSEPEDLHYANLMRHVQVISQKLDRYCVNFTNLEQKLHSQGKSSNQSQNYKEWLREMKASPNGKRFMEKLQRSLTRMWNDEKQKLKELYEAEFQTVKKMMKAKYKEELREQINARLEKKEATQVNREAVEEVLVNKMQSYEARDGDLEKRIEKLQEIVHEYKDDELKKGEEIKRMTKKITQTLKNVEKTVEKAPELLAQFTQINSHPSPNESDVEQIIKTAKTRIQQLEDEGEKLEKIFSSYLERQQDRRQNMELSRVQIWQRYQKDREYLQNAAGTNLRDRPGTLTTITQYSARKISETGSDEVSPIVECAHKNLEVENPFKTFNTATYLQKAHEKRLLEGPKIERLEAFRRLDREVESFKKQMSTMYPNGTSLTSRSIFGPPEHVVKNTLKENSNFTQELRKKIGFEPVSNTVPGVPTIQVQDADTTPGSNTTLNSEKRIVQGQAPEKLSEKSDTNQTEVNRAGKLQFDPQTNIAKSDKSSFVTKSEVLDLNEASFDIELSKSSSKVSLADPEEATNIPKPKSPSPKANKPSKNLLHTQDKANQGHETSTSDNKSAAVQAPPTRVLKPDEVQVHQSPEKSNHTPESSIEEELVEEVDIHLKNIDDQISEIEDKIQSLAEEESADIDEEIKKLDQEQRTEPKFVSLKSLDDRKLESPSLVSGLMGRFDRPTFSASDTKITNLQIDPFKRELSTSFAPKTNDSRPHFMSAERPRLEEISKYFSKVDNVGQKPVTPPPMAVPSSGLGQIGFEKKDLGNTVSNKTVEDKPVESVKSSNNGSKSTSKEDGSKKSIGVDLTLSSEDSDKIVISTGKQSHSENSDDFWKVNNNNF